MADRWMQRIISRHNLKRPYTTQPPSSSSSTSPPRPSRFSSYMPRLNALASRTGVPLPSLIVSFAVLHELTAILPLLGLFWGFQVTGAGGRIIKGIKELAVEEHQQDAHQEEGSKSGWSGMARKKLVEWVIEGETRVDRIAAKYGWFGYDKGKQGRRIVVSSSSSSEAGVNSRDGSGGDDAETMTDRLEMMTTTQGPKVGGGGDDGDGSQVSASSAAAASIASALGAYVVTKVGRQTKRIPRRLDLTKRSLFWRRPCALFSRSYLGAVTTSNRRIHLSLTGF